MQMLPTCKHKPAPNSSVDAALQIDDGARSWGGGEGGRAPNSGARQAATLSTTTSVPASPLCAASSCCAQTQRINSIQLNRRRQNTLAMPRSQTPQRFQEGLAVHGGHGGRLARSRRCAIATRAHAPWLTQPDRHPTQHGHAHCLGMYSTHRNDFMHLVSMKEDALSVARFTYEANVFPCIPYPFTKILTH